MEPNYFSIEHLFFNDLMNQRCASTQRTTGSRTPWNTHAYSEPLFGRLIQFGFFSISQNKALDFTAWGFGQLGYKGKFSRIRMR